MRATLATLLSACALASQSAGATTFDFYANGGSLTDTTSSVPSFTVGNLSVTLKAFVNGQQGLVDFRWDGIGVTNDNFFNVGELTQGESLQITFSQAVKLSSLGLSLWENGLFNSIDRATLSWGNQSIALNNSDTIGLVDTFKLNNVVGTTFTLTGTGLLTSFRLAGLQAQAVPEPGTWALMGLGLLGVAATTRQRRVALRA